jgi:hypothetical protein
LVVVAAFFALWLRDRIELNKLTEAQARATAAERQVLQFMMQLQTQNFGPPMQNSAPNFAPPSQPILPAGGAGEDGENSDTISDEKSVPNSPRDADESAAQSNSKLQQTNVPKRGEIATSESAAAKTRICVFPGENSHLNRT